VKPHIDGTAFGSIIIEGERHERDVIIRLNGAVKKRKKKLSKEVYGTSHTLSLNEAEHVYQAGAPLFIVGTGQYGQVQLSPEASRFFRDRNCQVRLLPTPEAIHAWNQAREPLIGLFHVTC
jgi:hypothetical protein